jgi:MFS family permease
MRKRPALFLAVLGNTYFWFLGSLLFSTIVVYGPDVLHVGQTKTGYLNAMLAVGIGIGSMAAGWVSDNKIEYGLIPLGSIGMTVHRPALGITPHGMAGSAVLLGMLGFWAGFFAVPVNALIQHKPGRGQGRHHCGRKSALVRWHRDFVGRVLRLHRIHSSRSARSHRGGVVHHRVQHGVCAVSCCRSGSGA